MRSALVAALGVVTTAALPASGVAAQRPHVAATRETVVSTIDERPGELPMHVIYIENRSTVPVTVFRIAVSGCENVRQVCGPRPVDLRVPPGRRQLAVRVEPKIRTRGFAYSFTFGWHADSGESVAAPADHDGTGTREPLTRQRADSLPRSAPAAPAAPAAPRAADDELSRDDFVAIAARAAALRAIPDSLVLAPGERTTMERIRIVVVDSQGVVLGRTSWVRWQAPTDGPVQLTPPEQLTARHPGRAVLTFSLAGEAQRILKRPLADLQVPVVAAYPADPRAPTLAGLVVDADRRTPLACTRVALEDSAQNVVARDRTSRLGAFTLRAPRPGTYRVRLESFGWAPAYGPGEVANAGETKQGRYEARFTELLPAGEAGDDDDGFRHAAVQAVGAVPVGGAPARRGAAAKPARTPVLRGVTFSGTASRPVLEIVGNAPAGATRALFVVDSAGRVETNSVMLPPDADPLTVASVRLVLARVRFAPARHAGAPACELRQVQVRVSGTGP